MDGFAHCCRPLCRDRCLFNGIQVPEGVACNLTLKSYAVVFGDPLGDKRREGDRKTLEGILRIRDPYPHPDWSKFLGLDYPNAQSQCKCDRAKQQGEIFFFLGMARNRMGGGLGKPPPPGTFFSGIRLR